MCFYRHRNVILSAFFLSSVVVWTATASEPRYFTIQFKGPIFESQKEKIRRLGGEILFYLPVNRFAARLSPSAGEKIVALPFVQSITPIERKYPFASWLTSIAPSETKNLIIEFFQGENIAVTLKKLRKNGIRINEVSHNLVRISANRNALSSLEKIEGISSIEEDIEFAPLESPFSAVLEKPFNDLTGYETGIRLIDSEKLAALGLSGHDEILGYSDTGLDELEKYIKFIRFRRKLS